MANIGQRVSAGRAMVAPLAILNFCMYMVILGLSGWAINRTMNATASAQAGVAGGNFSGVIARITTGNSATIFLVLFSLIAGVTGVASAIAGMVHTALWRAETLATAGATALIAWLLTLLSFGFACKEIHISGRSRRLVALESFNIILAATQLVYVITLHGLMSTAPSTRDPGYAAGAAGAQQQPLKGPGAASAV